MASLEAVGERVYDLNTVAVITTATATAIQNLLGVARATHRNKYKIQIVIAEEYPVAQVLAIVKDYLTINGIT